MQRDYDIKKELKSCVGKCKCIDIVKYERRGGIVEYCCVFKCIFNILKFPKLLLTCNWCIHMKYNKSF